VEALIEKLKSQGVVDYQHIQSFYTRALKERLARET